MDGDMVQEQQPQQPDVFLVEPPERDLLPPRRIHGKKNPDQLHPHYRSVRVLRHGGGVVWDPSDAQCVDQGHYSVEAMLQQGATRECDSLETA